MSSPFAFLPIKNHWPGLLLGLALLMLTLLAGLALLMLSGWFITASAMAGLGLIGMINIFTPGAAIRLAALTRTVARYGERLASHAATLQLLTSLRMRTFSALTKRPELELEQLQRGDTLSRLTADIDTLDHLYLGVFQPAAGAVLLTLATIALTALFSTTLAVLVILPLLLINLMIVTACHHVGKQASRQQALAYPALRQKILDGLEARLELRALGRLGEFSAQVNRESEALIKRGQRLARYDAIGGAAILTTCLITIAASLWLGLAEVSRGELSGAVLAAIVLGLFAISEAWLSLPAAWRRLSQSQVAAERVQEAMQQEDVNNLTTIRRPTSDWPTTPSITLRNVSFSWARHQPAVFTDFSLAIKHGERLAIVGKSGCGKTTLLRLLMGQIKPQQGQVMIGNGPVHELDSSISQRHLAYLPQNPVLFRDTVAGNLLLAKATATDAELTQALNQAGLSHWLAGLPLGLNTWIDEAASNLSGGQQRRLALARLFLCDPEIVLLDEPTASLDDQTLAEINQSLDAWLGGRTTVIITHRADALPPVDRILSLGNL